MPHFSDRNDPLEDGLNKGSVTDSAAPVDDVDDDDGYLDDREWVEMFRDALKAASDYQDTKLRSQWSRNYRAFASKHPSGSKYDAYRYRNRSKLFKPKTRMAVRKNDATAASALFATADVVNITAERSSDRTQKIGAKFIHALLNYRLDRSTMLTGPNWFLTSMGARQDTQLSGICVTKQYWEFEERFVPEIVEIPRIDVNGMPEIDPMTGAVMIDEDVEDRAEIVADRLMIDNIPPEHAFIDPTADWRDPIQTGGSFICAYPMRQEDVETMISKYAGRPRVGGGAWRTDIDLKKVLAAGKGPSQRRTETVRRAREGGVDRYESRHASKDSEILWLYECFYRYGGQDYHFWMLGETIMLSDPRPTKDSYPEQKGARPYTMGVGTLETHKTHPTAPVEMWSPLQNEMNEITNLTLDAQKMAISPITKVRRGRNIDLKQVQNRGPDATIMVQDKDDVEFDRAPGPDGSAQIQLNTLNVDFDELAGVFSTGSVQTNRQLNETVGGMNLMASSSSAITEFDLRVWAETWLEPTLRQCVRLIQFYESNETAMAIAGENAGVIMGGVPPKQGGALDSPTKAEQAEPKVSFDEVMDALDEMEVSVRVNIGIGALDSKQKIEKFMGGMKGTMEIAPLLKADGIMPNGAEMVDELWGLLGYKDADRFFKKVDPGEEKPDPEQQKQMLEMKAKDEEFKRKQAADQADQARKAEEHKWKQEDRMVDQAMKARDATAQHQQGLEKTKTDAAAKRTEQGLPGDEVFLQMVGEMEAGRTAQQAMLAQMLQTMQQQNQQFAESIKMLGMAITAPRTVQLPDGRKFTATAGGEMQGRTE